MLPGNSRIWRTASVKDQRGPVSRFRSTGLPSFRTVTTPVQESQRMVDLRNPGRLLPLVLLLATLGSLSGCVERRYTVRTNPPGALLVANDEEIGATPTSRSF